MLDAGLLRGRKLGLDASTMEGNASIGALVNRMSPLFDRNREGRKTSNQEWVNPHDSDEKAGRRKDGAFDMVHKPEHTADLESGALLAAEVQPGDTGDAEGFAERVATTALAAREACGLDGGKALLRARAEKVERSFAHVLDSGE